MGEVYLSVDQRLGNPVALKRTVFRDDAMMWDAFEREARILARLRHPVLPKVSDHFSEKDEQYLVMEYISGDDLSKRLDAAKKPFPLQWVLYWADELLDALSYLHTHEPPIIHRDIKPQNLKLTNENHVVLLDFGLAKNSVAKKTHLSSSGSLVGYTPNYAPIEQIRGTGTGAHSDIYSLSATLYQLLTGTVPVDALTRAESVIGGMGDALPTLREIVPGISAEISAVILRGMALNSEQRYPEAKEMQKALREAYALYQAQAESFEGEETIVPEAKAAPPSEAMPGEKKEAFIFSHDEVEGMFSAAQDPPVTLTAAALEGDTAILPPVADFTATIPAEHWSEGETQGFTHDEMRRSTVDEEAFKQFGFDVEAAQAAAEGRQTGNGFDMPPYIEEDSISAPAETRFETVADTVPPEAAAEKPTPIRPVTKPLEPVKKSSGWGLKLIGVAAVLCFLIAGAGAAGWYAVSAKLINIPGLSQPGSGEDKPAASETRADPATADSATDSTDAKNPADPASDTSTVPDGQASESAASQGANSTDVNSEAPGETRANSADRKSNQQSKAPQKAETKPAKSDKKKTQQGSRTDILQ